MLNLPGQFEAKPGGNLQGATAVVVDDGQSNKHIHNISSAAALIAKKGYKLKHYRDWDSGCQNYGDEPEAAAMRSKLSSTGACAKIYLIYTQFTFTK
jgi:hypothetical protein